MLLILLMSKGSKVALTVLIVTHVTHVERVESGVCGLYTQYRYIQCYVERVWLERSKSQLSNTFWGLKIG